MLKSLRENKYFRKILILLSGSLKGSLVFVIGLCCLAIAMGLLKTESVVFYYALYFFIILGAFTCAVATCKKLNGRGFLVGLLSSIPYSLIVLLCTAILTEFRLSPDIFMVFVLSLLGGFLGGITAVNTRI